MICDDDAPAWPIDKSLGYFTLNPHTRTRLCARAMRLTCRRLDAPASRDGPRPDGGRQGSKEYRHTCGHSRCRACGEEGGEAGAGAWGRRRRRCCTSDWCRCGRRRVKLSCLSGGGRIVRRVCTAPTCWRLSRYGSSNPAVPQVRVALIRDVLYVCHICLPYMSALYVCLICLLIRDVLVALQVRII